MNNQQEVEFISKDCKDASHHNCVDRWTGLGLKIKCACLGAVFNLPMSTVTIIEDAIMIAMSGTMILMLI